MNKQQGFTLIELVVVIIILGILAVTAAPKFLNLQSDARASTIKGLEAAIKGADTLVNSKSLIAGNEKVASDASSAPSVIVDAGNSVLLNYGHALPQWADSLANALDINASDKGTSSEWLYVEDSQAKTIYFYPQGSNSPKAANEPGTCYVEYINNLTSYGPITVNAVTTGC
ncbi:type II secretion system protein [Shewanella indica]|jgi:MSHA pilin protein MshA|uniref:MSHA pilin protein MshA n=1 Tax=Shewanella chilikensis TaxID=558541 RepID=A0ABX5PMV0_9GAMM|nr:MULTISPECIES: prepilin-type N-terminal cleavage/methylation domain-containing protein [Shewanella]MBZ4677569.1 methylation site containing protein [Shewanella sp.]MCA0949945.1 prepilin-type N-terminal cleavage/methylation domain-containing protein [Shewanella chilikensis]MCE9851323.1 prepilin-type N-terminal cleavage/methylation domain-containing protein [Shewanella chilikensis]MCL1154109.1 prepilin-type N-terminal cleavage/methylation domain-containing protein [Shewanella chilikensis]PYE58